MVNPIRQETKQVVEEILTRAANEIEFREVLLLNPAEALKDYPLTPEEKEIIASLKKVALEEWGVDTRRHMLAIIDNGNSITNRA